jgi:tRNA U55 pseudouridine synthase TruB
LSTLADLGTESIFGILQKMEVVLADIPVIDIDVDIARKVRYGQKVSVNHPNAEKIWLRYNGQILAIGSMRDCYFDSARVINVE